jgi:hypothetical protein
MSTNGRPRIALGAVAPALAAVLLASCSSGGGTGPLVTTKADVSVARQVLAAGPTADVPAAALVEPTVVRKADQLVRQAAQNTSFCALVSALDEVTEPDPSDVADLLSYASRSYNLLYSLDRRSRVNDVSQVVGQQRKVALPAARANDVEAMRRAMYAYFVRLKMAAAMRSAKLIAPEQLQPRLDAAQVRLATSPYGEAERRVVEYSIPACTSTGVGG